MIEFLGIIGASILVLTLTSVKHVIAGEIGSQAADKIKQTLNNIATGVGRSPVFGEYLSDIPKEQFFEILDNYVKGLAGTVKTELETVLKEYSRVTEKQLQRNAIEIVKEAIQTNRYLQNTQDRNQQIIIKELQSFKDEFIQLGVARDNIIIKKLDRLPENLETLQMMAGKTHQEVVMTQQDILITQQQLKELQVSIDELKEKIEPQESFKKTVKDSVEKITASLQGSKIGKSREILKDREKLSPEHRDMLDSTGNLEPIILPSHYPVKDIRAITFIGGPLTDQALGTIRFQPLDVAEELVVMLGSAIESFAKELYSLKDIYLPQIKPIDFRTNEQCYDTNLPSKKVHLIACHFINTPAKLLIWSDLPLLKEEPERLKGNLRLCLKELIEIFKEDFGKLTLETIPLNILLEVADKHLGTGLNARFRLEKKLFDEWRENKEKFKKNLETRLEESFQHELPSRFIVDLNSQVVFEKLELKRHTKGEEGFDLSELEEDLSQELGLNSPDLILVLGVLIKHGIIVPIPVEMTGMTGNTLEVKRTIHVKLKKKRHRDVETLAKDDNIYVYEKKSTNGISESELDMLDEISRIYDEILENTGTIIKRLDDEGKKIYKNKNTTNSLDLNKLKVIFDSYKEELFNGPKNRFFSCETSLEGFKNCTASGKKEFLRLFHILASEDDWKIIAENENERWELIQGMNVFDFSDDVLRSRDRISNFSEYLKIIEREIDNHIDNEKHQILHQAAKTTGFYLKFVVIYAILSDLANIFHTISSQDESTVNDFLKAISGLKYVYENSDELLDCCYLVEGKKRETDGAFVGYWLRKKDEEKINTFWGIVTVTGVGYDKERRLDDKVDYMIRQQRGIKLHMFNPFYSDNNISFTKKEYIAEFPIFPSNGNFASYRPAEDFIRRIIFVVTRIIEYARGLSVSNIPNRTRNQYTVKLFRSFYPSLRGQYVYDKDRVKENGKISKILASLIYPCPLNLPGNYYTFPVRLDRTTITNKTLLMSIQEIMTFFFNTLEKINRPIDIWEMSENEERIKQFQVDVFKETRPLFNKPETKELIENYIPHEDWKSLEAYLRKRSTYDFKSSVFNTCCDMINGFFE